MGYYTEADGLKFLLEKLWAEKKEQFPKDGYDFVEGFREIEKFLDDNYHDEVDIGAAVHGSGLVTKHGKSHVEMVIKYIYELLQCSSKELSGYEVFIILLATNFHDIGNITGREEHEQKIYEIMEEIGSKIHLDNPAKRMVVSIATAHSGFIGKHNKNRDTLSSLKEHEPLNGLYIRPVLLAALLRFADELADDHTRASKMREENIPDKNLIYHKYSKSLSPITFGGKTISFSYEIEHSDVTNKINKGSTELYLYDEIIHRLKKCLCELEYCRKYADGTINISTFNVRITIVPDGKFNPISERTFSLRLSGYPNIEYMKIENLLSPNDRHNFVSSGECLKQDIEKLITKRC